MGQKISKATLQLLATLCEQSRPRTGGEKMSDHFRKEGEEAIRLGALRQGPVQTLVPDRTNHEGRYVEAEWDASTKGYRYFSFDARGWISVPKEDLLTWDLDMAWFFDWIAGQFGLKVPASPNVLLTDHLWHLGTPWIGKRKCGLFFTRRLGFNKAYDQVVDTLRDRTGEPAGMLLTTSTWTVQNAHFPGNHRVVRLQDCFPTGEKDARIDMYMVSRVLAGLDAHGRDSPVQFSNDYGSVTINGRSFVFRGDTQKLAVGFLIEAWERGEVKVRTDIMLDAIRSEAGQVLRLFKGHPDWKDLIGYGDGFCWLKF